MSRKKSYEARLAELGLPKLPDTPQLSPPRQFQLAHLAATLASGLEKDGSAIDLTARSMKIWNAAGRLLLIERQVKQVVRGLMVFEPHEWSAHAEALVALFNDSGRSFATRIYRNEASDEYEVARQKAGRAVAVAWVSITDQELLQILFPARSETVKGRKSRLGKLLQFAESRNAAEVEASVNNRDKDPLTTSIERAWSPLSLPIGPPDLLQQSANTVARARRGLTKMRSGFGYDPIVTRWITVMRQEQLAAAKKRR